MKMKCGFEDVCVCLDNVQGEVDVSKFNPDVTDRQRDDWESPSSHRSYQTAQQQVSLLP